MGTCSRTGLWPSFSRSWSRTRRIGADAIRLVDEGDPRNLVPVHLPVYGEGLALDTRHGAKHQHCPVEHAKAAFDLDGEIHMSRRIDDVHMMVLPTTVGCGARYSDAALPLEIHRVHLRPYAVFAFDVVDHVDPLGVVQDSLGQRRLATVDVSRDPNVANGAQILDHLNTSSFSRLFPNSP